MSDDRNRRLASDASLHSSDRYKVALKLIKTGLDGIRSLPLRRLCYTVQAWTSYRPALRRCCEAVKFCSDKHHTPKTSAASLLGKS